MRIRIWFGALMRNLCGRCMGVVVLLRKGQITCHKRLEKVLAMN